MQAVSVYGKDILQVEWGKKFSGPQRATNHSSRCVQPERLQVRFSALVMVLGLQILQNCGKLTSCLERRRDD